MELSKIIHGISLLNDLGVHIRLVLPLSHELRLACRVLARLDTHGLSAESIATLLFLVQAQALFMAPAHDDTARGRWAAFAGLTGAADSKARDSSDLFRRLSTATFSAQLPHMAGRVPKYASVPKYAPCHVSSPHAAAVHLDTLDPEMKAWCIILL